MREFISKYELRMIRVKEHQFHDRNDTRLYSRKQLVILPKCTFSI
jgi:hypothetical protein